MAHLLFVSPSLKNTLIETYGEYNVQSGKCFNNNIFFQQTSEGVMININDKLYPIDINNTPKNIEI